MDNLLVTIISCEKEETADFIKEKLEFDDIQCFMSDEALDYSKDDITKTIYKLKVRASDTELAVKSLIKITKHFDLAKIKKDDTIKGLKKILVPIDLSDYALNVSKYAIAVAKQINAELKFLYVYKDPAETGYVKKTSSWYLHTARVAEETLADAQEKLLKFSDKLKDYMDEKKWKHIKLHYTLHKGEPIDVIKFISKKYEPNLMILGPRGQRDKRNVFIGSVTTSVIENSIFPVLTVPKNAEYTGHQFNVMYATNFNEADYSSLSTLQEILSPFETDIHCIHIDAGTDPMKKGKMQELNSFLTDKYPNSKIQCDLFENTDLLQGFNDFIKDKEINMLSFSSPKRNLMYKVFNSNKLKKMVEASKIPMLIFRIHD